MKMNEPDVFFLSFVLVGVLVGLLVGIGIGAALCYFISSWLKEVPEEDRVMTPGQVWLCSSPFLTFIGTSVSTCTTGPSPSKIIFSDKEKKGMRKSATVAKQWGMWLCICTLFQLDPFRRLNRGNGYLGLFDPVDAEDPRTQEQDHRRQAKNSRNLGKFSQAHSTIIDRRSLRLHDQVTLARLAIIATRHLLPVDP